MANNGKKYITLKQAAQISGYAPDYIGQLIRKGKLPGKQIYKNVAWVTTEEAVQEYIHQLNNNENGSLGSRAKESYKLLKSGLLLESEIKRLFKTLLYLSVILAISFTLVLFHIFSVSLEKKLTAQALHKIEINYNKQNPGLNTKLPTIP